MAERRSLTAGLDEMGGVDPEMARAFIAQEKPKPSPVQIVPEPAAVKTAETPDAQVVVDRVSTSSAKYLRSPWPKNARTTLAFLRPCLCPSRCAFDPKLLRPSSGLLSNGN